MVAAKVLILDNLKKISNLYAVSIETYVGCEVIQSNDIEEANSLISSEKPEIIITRGKINDRDIGQKFHQTITENKLTSNLIVIGKTALSAHHAVTLKEKVEVGIIIRNVASILGVTATEMASREVGDYYEFDTGALFSKLELVADIYIKDAEDNYTIFLETGSVISSEILKILTKQNHEKFHVKANQRLKFVNSMMSYIGEFLASDQLTLQDTVLFGNKAFKMIRESAQKLQITPEVIQMTEANINTMMSIVANIPKINKIIEITTKSSDDHFKHSLLICYISSHIIDHMEWGSRDQKIKLAFVSFFHNISIPSECILVNTDEELENSNFNDDIKKKVKNHALDAAKVIAKFNMRIPFGVDTIIKQHHGARDGIGFEQYPKSISPLALIFLVADDWVTALMRSEKIENTLSNSQLLELTKRKYNGSIFEPIIKALEELE